MVAATDNALPARTRREKLVMWQAGATDDWGEPTLSSPEEVNCRIERDYKDVVVDGSTQTRLDYKINVDRDIPEGSWIWVGAIADIPDPVPNTLIVYRFEKIPNTRSSKFDRWIHVMNNSDKTPEVV